MASTGRHSTLTLVIVAAVSLSAGYFAGREHVKYQLRSAFMTAAEEITKGIAEAFGGLDSPRADIPAAAATAPQQPARPAKSERTPPPPQLIGVTLTKKTYRPSNWQARVYEDAIQFSLELENLSGQDIRAFEGTLAFYDLLDNLILRSKLTITDPIKAAGKLTWDGQIDYNQFRDDHRRLANEDLENIKTSFLLSKILYADGTSQEF